MIFYLTGFMVAIFFPLFVSSWRVAFLGLALQGLCIALVSLGHGIAFETTSLLQMMDLVCLRFIAVPVVFLVIVRKIRHKPEFDLIPANLVTWILAIGLLIMALSLGHRLYPEDLVLTFHTGAVASAFLAGLFILSVQGEPLGQMIGLLYFESGLTLFENFGHREPWFIQMSISLLFLWLLILMGRFVHKFAHTESETEPALPLNSEVL